MTRRQWTRDELILAMNLYCQLPFGRLHARNPDVVQLAEFIGRTPSSVAMKLCNLASLDPFHKERGIRGLSKVAQGDREVWDEFHSHWSRLAEESETLRLQFMPPTADEAEDTVCEEAALGIGESVLQFAGETERQATTSVRLAQRFFRRSVLASYDSECCVSGIRIRSLLVASHILPWSAFPAHRADPRNGLCLSRLHDAAFDRGLITLDGECRLVLSRELNDHTSNRVLREAFTAFEGMPIRLPQKFRPLSEFLDGHRNTIFCG